MKNLPELPNLKFLLREAKSVKASHRNGDASICEIIGHYDTSLHGLTNQQILDTHFSIIDAQRVVARQHGFSSWSRMKKFVQQSWSGQNPKDAELRTEILDRYKAIVAIRSDIKNKRGDYDSNIKKHEILTQSSVSFMSRAYERHGWPGPEVTGPDCVDAAFVVAGSALYDADFQAKTVRLLDEGLSEGSCLACSHSLLLDRYLVLSKKPAVYGIAFESYFDEAGEVQQLIPDVVDPDNLDKRRATVGRLAMVEDKKRYAKEVEENNWNLKTRQHAIDRLDQISIRGGYINQ